MDRTDWKFNPTRSSDDIASAIFLTKNYRYDDGRIALVWCANLPDDEQEWTVSFIDHNYQSDIVLKECDENGNHFHTADDIMSYCDRTYGKNAEKATRWIGMDEDFVRVYLQYPDGEWKNCS